MVDCFISHYPRTCRNFFLARTSFFNFSKSICTIFSLFTAFLFFQIVINRFILDLVVQEIIDEEDERLKGLKDEYGEELYKAVITALIEMHEYNPSGRYVISEIWNYKKGRKASMREVVVSYILKQWETSKWTRNWRLVVLQWNLWTWIV